jgi:phospholipase/lecithinase/hemolysin
MIRRLRRACRLAGSAAVGVGCCAAPVASVASAAPGGVAVLGDSVGDEYAFPINFPAGGDRRNSKNYVELLGLLRPADFGFGAFTAVPRPAPRNAGFEFNWAEDGATTADMIAGGQHAGAAAQAAAGQVRYVFVEIGGNDFRGVFLPGADPQQIATGALVNTLTAVGTILAADPDVRVVVGNVPDITLLPEARFAALQDPTLVPLLGAVSGLIDQYNAGLAAQLNGLPGSNRIAQVDVNGLFEALINTPNLTFGGMPVDTLAPGDGAGHLFADLLHPGTMGSGHIANGFIDAVNARFDAGVPRLTDGELLSAVPEPTGAASLLVVAGLVARRRHRRT